MAEGVSGRLRHAGLKAGTVTVKIRDSGFNTITRQRGLPEPTDLTEPIWRTAAASSPGRRCAGKRIRLLGRGGVGLRGARAARAVRGGGRRDGGRVVEAADEVRERFGTRAVTRARLLRTGMPAPFERDLGTAVERRGEHAEDRRADGRRAAARSAVTAKLTRPPPEDAFDD